MTMATVRTCRQCGSTIGSRALSGLCPVCLGRVSLGFEEGTSDDAAVEGAGAASRTRLGDYELLEPIASGGMGVVFRAHQTSLNRIVALKLMRSGQFADASELRRFKTEAQAAAQLQHPNIVPVYEVGEHQGRA